MDPEDRLQCLLQELWEQHKPEISARVDLLAATADAVRSGTLTAEQRDVARSAAHKLAGSLGTFGRSEGTRIAQRLEKLLAGEAPLGENLETLEQAIADLRRLII